MPSLEDYRGLPIRPRDLNDPDAFKNGRSKKDIYRTIMTGLDGTPMPAFYGSFPEENNEEAWHIVNYVLSLSGEPEEP